MGESTWHLQAGTFRPNARRTAFLSGLTERRRTTGQQSEVTIDDTWGITEFWTDDMPQDKTTPGSATDITATYSRSFATI